MQFKLAAASLLAVAGLSSSAPVEVRQDTTNCPVVQEGDYIWKIDDFFARKPDGQKITALGFNVKATNNGTADFDCSVSADPVEDGKFYECGPNSFIYFAYQQDRSGLLLKQDVSDDIQYIAATTLPNYCRAGGNGPDDFVCQGTSPAYITLVQYPGKLE
ncbi:Alt a 1 major allergen [Melanomma pulvis-pyrius CBS 109.77]|uniref:Alt a 1 major allergen n=1 Tax=Melanomma pulvis-pyrius CBS 109.77 TaxID=1314802 RepID=A0A6A6X149_9PLEO|nr:Alt a 1 major allergen [Melanomma pulvis-pyrius CBS 109.77]